MEDNSLEYALAISESDELIYAYDSSLSEWILWVDPSMCNDGYSASISNSSVNISCDAIEDGAYTSQLYGSINW